MFFKFPIKNIIIIYETIFRRTCAAFDGSYTVRATVLRAQQKSKMDMTQCSRRSPSAWRPTFWPCGDECLNVLYWLRATSTALETHRRQGWTQRNLLHSKKKILWRNGKNCGFSGMEINQKIFLSGSLARNWKKCRTWAALGRMFCLTRHELYSTKRSITSSKGKLNS